MRVTIIAAIAGLLASSVQSLAINAPAPIPKREIQKRSRGIKQHEHPSPDQISNGTFNQLLDHSDPKKGTFKQRYWYDASNWKGPGSPVFLFNVGESAADNFLGYLHDGTISGRYAKEFEGAVIVIEHRYWGQSIPFTKLTSETLQYLDLPQSVHDMTYFAKTVKLDFDDSNGGANAPSAPWVLVGGSYPGALAAWTSIIDPGTFWAYHASSAVVEAIYDFYPYFDAVERAIPRNCSADVRAVITHIDSVFANGTQQDIADLKAMFGLEGLEYADDFAARVTDPLWEWQHDPKSVFKFCDFIETGGKKSSTKSSTNANGVGMQAALAAYAAYIKQTSDCGTGDDCSTHSGQYNQPNDLDGDRQWDWMLCHNPFSWWQVGPPKSDGTHVVSSLLRPDHWQRQCDLKFPEVNGQKPGATTGWTTEHLNMYTGGWDATYERVLFVNGQFDPWIEATVSSTHRSGGPRKSTDQTPILTIQKGNHVPDLILDDVPEERSVLDQEIAIMKKWLGEWKAPN